MISICIIVKDEEKNIKICLEKLINIGYEIIVIDTGSKDNTKKIVKEYTENVYDFTWCGDFSKARNFAASKASNDMILMVDSDEFLSFFDKEGFEKLVKLYPEKVGRIKRTNLFAREGIGFSAKENVNRIYSKKLYKYDGMIHEQIVSIVGNGYETYVAPIMFDHSGYDGDLNKRKEKSQRNIEMLKIALKEGADPYILYQLGKSYYLQEEYEQASRYFSEGLTFDLNIELEYVIDMVEMYGYSLINSGQNKEALMFENIYNEFMGSADFVFLMGFIYMQNLMFDKAEKEFLKASTYTESKVEGVNSYLAYYNAGVIRECLGDKKKALDYFSRCGDYELALEGIKRCM